MNRELLYVIEQIGREKGIEKEVLFEAVESALLSASKKTMGAADNVTMHLDRQTGELKILCRKKVVDKVTDPQIEMGLAEARALVADAKIDDEVDIPLAPRDFGRIAAQTAKQVILQRVREAEREGIFAEFSGKEGHIIRGVVHRIEKRTLIVDVGKTEAIVPEREQIPGERFSPGDRIRAYVLEVRKNPKGPQITLSRTHPGFLVRLFEAEVPEVAEGIVQIKAAAREPGERAKIAVTSTKRDVDPVGACVGLRGTRIQVIGRELRGEKIDIIEWAEDSLVFVSRALSPAKASSVTWHGEGDERSVLVVVPENQLSLSIGKKGQNARLAAKLTGFRIDIKSETELEAERRAEEEEREKGLQQLLELPGVGTQLAESLYEHGFFSPKRISRADVEKLREVRGVGERKAERLLEAAREWLAGQAQGSLPVTEGGDSAQ
jgi:N utilization substance protein A